MIKLCYSICERSLISVIHTWPYYEWNWSLLKINKNLRSSVNYRVFGKQDSRHKLGEPFVWVRQRKAAAAAAAGWCLHFGRTLTKVLVGRYRGRRCKRLVYCHVRRKRAGSAIYSRKWADVIRIVTASTTWVFGRNLKLEKLWYNFKLKKFKMYLPCSNKTINKQNSKTTTNKQLLVQQQNRTRDSLWC